MMEYDRTGRYGTGDCGLEGDFSRAGNVVNRALRIDVDGKNAV